MASITQRNYVNTGSAPNGTATSTAVFNQQTPVSVSKTDTTRESPRKTSPASSQWWLLAVCAFIVAFYALLFLLPAHVAEPEVKTRMLKSPHGWLHVVGGMTAMATGPFQFHRGLRARSPKTHRVVGRVYVVANVSSAVGGFWVTWNSYANPIGRVGFAALAACWLLSCCLAMLAIQKRDVEAHRVWMARNYSLTYAAVMLRWQLPVLIFVFGFPSVEALSAEGFLCWMPNLIFTEWYLKRQYKAV